MDYSVILTATIVILALVLLVAIFGFFKDRKIVVRGDDANARHVLLGVGSGFKFGFGLGLGLFLAGLAISVIFFAFSGLTIWSLVSNLGH